MSHSGHCSPPASSSGIALPAQTSASPHSVLQYEAELRASRLMTITLRGLRLHTLLGVHDHERTAKREVVLNVQITTDLSTAVMTDDIQDTIDYKAIINLISAVVETATCFLLESLVGAVLRDLARHPLIQAAWVEVEKPGALRLVDSISVSASWSRCPNSSQLGDGGASRAAVNRSLPEER